MRNKLKIALLTQSFGWGGGIDFLRNIVNALLYLQNTDNLEIFLLLPVKNRIDSFTDLRGVTRDTAVKLVRQRKLFLPRSEPAYDTTFHDFFSNVDGKIEFVEYNNATSALLSALQKVGANVVIPVFRFSRQVISVSLGWLYLPFPA